LQALLRLGGALLHRRPPTVDPAWPTAALALLFVPLAGYGAPASRAAVALALAVLAPRLPRALGGPRRPCAENLLGLALVLELVLDPLAPLSPGVQLSYGATAALVLVGSRAARRTRGTLPGFAPVAEVSRTGHRRWALGRALAGAAQRATAAALAASVVASLATLPTVWSTFGEFAPIGAVGTPVAFVPMAALVGLGWCYAVSPGGTWLDDGLALACEGAARAMLAVLEVLDGAPLSPCALPARDALLVGFFCALALTGLAARRARFAGTARRAAALVLAVLIAPWPGARPGGLEVTVLDVGDGLAVLATAPDGEALLLDAGSRDRIGVASGAVLPLLRTRDVGALTVALSHDHADHAGDLARVAGRHRVHRWIGAPSRTVRPPAGCRWIRPGTGVTAGSSPGARLEVRVLRAGPFEGNEGSLVLDLRWHGARPARVVLSGDAEGHGLAALLDGPLTAGPVDALLLPHHGSDSPHLGNLLDRLCPEEVWISASSPAPPALDEVLRRRIPALVTGRDGPIARTLGPGLRPRRLETKP
ncbi:MAG: ComEC/Rec2 family competence protein, partial [Planctomycetota bacterium]